MSPSGQRWSDSARQPQWLRRSASASGHSPTLRDLLPEIDLEAVIDAGRDVTGASLAVEVTASVNDEQQYYARNTLQWTKITTAIAALLLLQVWSSDPRVQRWRRT